MLKVKATVKTPVAVMKDGAPVVEFQTETIIALVASTKSYNNFMDDLRAQGKNPDTTTTKELFIDKEEAREAIRALVETDVKDPEYQEAVINHIMKALDGACVFKKPPVVRKKA